MRFLRHAMPWFFAGLATLLIQGQAMAVGNACTTSETQLWACEANGKLYTICTSRDLGPQTGTMQYRVYQGATLEFAYPAKTSHPRGLFQLSLMPRGAQMRFKNGAYEYRIAEPLAGSTEISVNKGSKNLARFNCADFTDTLTETSTQDFLATVGVYER